MSRPPELTVVRSFLRARASDRASVGDWLYRAYLVALFLGIAYIVVVIPVRDAVPAPSAVRAYARWAGGALPALALALIAAGARLGTWAGPVLVSRAESHWLLPSPLPKVELLRPHLIRGLVAGAGLGGSVGLLVGVATHVLAGAPISAMVVAVLGWAAVGTMSAVVSWHVESSAGASRIVSWATPAVIVLCVALFLAGRGNSSLALWSGPWGWAVAPHLDLAGFGSPSAWATGGLTVVVVVAAAAHAVRGLRTVHREQVAKRAGVRRGLLAAAYVLDVRTLSLIRQRQSAPGRTPRLRLPVPRSPRLAVPWRGATALVRSPGRLAWAAFAVAVAVGSAMTAPAVPAVAAAGVAAYTGASRLMEPMRIEVDDPIQAELLPIPYARVVLQHTIVPVAVLTVAGWIAVLGWFLAGATSARAVAALVLVPGASCLLVGCASLAVVRVKGPLDYLVAGEFGVYAMAAAAVQGPVFAAVLAALPVAVVRALQLSGVAAIGFLGAYLTAASYLAFLWVRRRVARSGP